MRRTYFPALLAGLCVALISLLLFLLQPRFLLGLQLRIEDRIASAADHGIPSPRIVIVDLDEASLAQFGRWPWPRDHLGRLVRALFNAGARTVALDMMFPEPDSGVSGLEPGKTNDQVFAESFAGGRVVVGYHFGFDPARPAQGCVLHPVPVAGPTLDLNLFQATQVLCTLPVLASAAAGSGFLNASPDLDGVLRRVPLLIWYRNRIYPSLALGAWIASRTESQAVSLDAFALKINGSPVPIDERGGLRLRFRGPRGTLARVSAADAMNGRVAVDALQGKVAFLGASAHGLQDTVATPLDSLVSGVEVQASALDNLFQGDAFRDSGPARGLELALILMVCFLSVFFLTRFRSLWAVPMLLGLAVSGWLLCFWLLASHHTIVSPMIFTGSIGGNFALITLVNLASEKRRADQADRKLAGARKFMLNALTLLAEARDVETGAHLVRTQKYTRLLCDALASHSRFSAFLTPQTIDLMVQIVPLHDIGKVGVPDSILKKPGPLTPDEYSLIQRHVEYGYEVLEKARIRSGVEDEELLDLAREIVHSHHERWDGKGYPDGLKADLIPIPGRIVAIVDMYDALVSKRVYKDRMQHDEAVKLVASGRGERFDPDIVDAFLRTQEQWRKVALEHGDDPSNGGSSSIHP